MKIDWFWMIFFVLMMLTIGFIIFDNIGVALAFGLGTGIGFGAAFSSSKKSKE